MSYIKKISKLALDNKIDLTKKAELEIIKIYSKAVTDMSEDLRRARLDQDNLEPYIRQKSQAMYKELQGTIESYIGSSSKQAYSLHRDVIDEIFKEVADVDTTPLFQGISKEVIEILLSGGIYVDGQGLDARIWNASYNNGQYLHEVIYSGIVSGRDAFQLAQDLEEFVHPTKRNVWDSEKIKEVFGEDFKLKQTQVEYNALRLARTSIAHASTLSNKLSAERNPFVKKFRWRSVHAHGRTCEECMERDGNIYTIEDLPYDHPNGMCWEEFVLDKDLSEYTTEVIEWLEGGDNKELDEWYDKYGSDILATI